MHTEAVIDQLQRDRAVRLRRLGRRRRRPGAAAHPPAGGPPPHRTADPDVVLVEPPVREREPVTAR